MAQTSNFVKTSSPTLDLLHVKRLFFAKEHKRFHTNVLTPAEKIRVYYVTDKFLYDHLSLFTKRESIWTYLQHSLWWIDGYQNYI
jgi:hypothetical protein